MSNRNTELPDPLATGLPADTALQSTASSKASADRSAPLLPGYILQEEVGHGAMGIIYRARDLKFDRTVAVKFLQQQFVGSELAEQFLNEARITGQLQHPGIPPVHDVGTLDDGRPWLAMKLIRGHALSDRGPRTDTLAIFEAIAQAVGYAHAHGVIHRDLKPSNIMVGTFGEVQVMDWGLAKLLAKADPLPRQPLHPQSEIRVPGTAEATVVGGVKGTPSFMAPEQASGAGNRVDERSDVFGLGGVLCWLLTGTPPFKSESLASTWQMSAEANLDDAYARLSACDAEPEVVALCKKCLSADPEDRYANGHAVAEAVAELRRAADERARDAEVRRGTAEFRRRLQLKLGSAIALTALVGAGLALWQAREARHEANLARQKSMEAQQATARANVSAEQARERYMLALEAFNQMVFSIQEKLETRPATQALRKDLLENAKVGLKKLLAEAEKQGEPDGTLAWAHFQMGDLELQLGSTPNAEREFTAGNRIAAAYAEAHPENARARRVLAVSHHNLGRVLLRLRRSEEAVRHFQTCLDISDENAKRNPDDVEAQRDLSVARNQFGDVLLRLGRPEDALAHYQKSLEIRERIAIAEPEDPKAKRDVSISHNNVGHACLRLNRSDDALRHYQKALAIREALALQDRDSIIAQRDLAVSHGNLGDIFLGLNRPDDALQHFRAFLTISERIAGSDPGNLEARRDLAISLAKVGDVLLQRGKSAETLEHYRKGLAITEKLAEADPENQDAQRDLSVCHDKLGNVLLRLEKPADALVHNQQSLAIRLRLAASDPTNLESHRDLGISHDKLGETLLQLHKTEDALVQFRKALDLRERLARQHPAALAVQRDIAISNSRFGDAYFAINDYANAIAWYEKMIDYAQKHPDIPGQKVVLDYGADQIAICRKAMTREIAPPPRRFQ